jgi:hypothetical protein
LCQDADDNHNHKHICRIVSKLVVSGKGELKRYTKRLDSHDGYAAYGTADGDVDEGILAAIFGGDLVYHDDGKHDNDEAVKEECC